MSRIHILKGFSDLDGALWVLKYHPGLRSRSDIVQTILENGRTVTDRSRFEILQLLREWGLADHQQKSLTPRGEEFYSLWVMKPDIAIDVLHGLQYGLWTKHDPAQHLASWAYQKVCDYLWEYKTLPQTRDLIASIYDSREDLSKSQGDIANAFSSKSVNSSYDWLSHLTPSVLKDVSETSTGRKNFRRTRFARRFHCSPALFLMGLNWIAREAEIKSGELVEIDADRRLQLCRFCLLEENQFDFMLNETLRRFAMFLSVERIGRLFVVINREPIISDF